MGSAAIAKRAIIAHAARFRPSDWASKEKKNPLPRAVTAG